VKVKIGYNVITHTPTSDTTHTCKSYSFATLITVCYNPALILLSDILIENHWTISDKQWRA